MKWTDQDLHILDLLYGRFCIRIVAEKLKRSGQACRIMAHRRAKERERVEAARKLRNA